MMLITNGEGDAVVVRDMDVLPPPVLSRAGAVGVEAPRFAPGVRSESENGN
jgi:hypothetical protein